MQLVKTALAIICFFSVTGLYDLQVTRNDGSTLHLGDLQGKKILFVNTATNSPYTSQYAGLEQLYQKYKDSLEIIALPSNSFGNEPGDDTAINQFVQSNYGIHFILASKISVAGDDTAPLYQWLTKETENEVMDTEVGEDFYKFLVDQKGRLVAAFVGQVDPMDELVQNAIRGGRN